MSETPQHSSFADVDTAPPPATHNLNFFNADGTIAREALREYLLEVQGPLDERKAELLAAGNRVPSIVDDEDTYQRMLDFSAQLATLITAIDGDHRLRKGPWLTGGQVVDNRWHELRDPILGLRVTVDRRAKTFADAKAERERQARIAAQRAAEAEAARLKAEAEAAEQAMLAQAEPTMEHLDQAIATETAATKAEVVAVQATRAAEAKPSELARTRTPLGALGTLQAIWIFTDLDRAKIDLETLRPHLSTECIEKALRSFIKAGGRSIAGATIGEDTKLQVRK